MLRDFAVISSGSVKNAPISRSVFQMISKEELNGRRGKLLVTGTLAMFAMGGLRADAATTNDKDDHKAEPNANGERTHAGTEEQTRPSQVVYTFDIPAGSLAEVTEALAKETKLNITVSSKRFAAVPSPGVKGVMTVEEALTAALNGTKMAANFVSPERVTVDVQGADQSVTVTATSELPSPKYTAPLRDLPQTLTIIPQAIIENTGSTTLVEALRTVPGITFGAGEGGNPVGDRPYIRGVDSQSSTFVDGMRDIGAQSREVFNLESVEVSKGPSGGFAGRGASGGSINLNTKMARREQFLAGSFSPGTANFFRGSADGGAKLTKSIAGRLNGVWQDSDTAGRDYVRNGRYGFAPALLFNLGNRVRLNTNYYHLMTNDVPDPGMPYNNPTFFARIDGRAQTLQPGDGQPLVVNRNNFYGINSRDFRNEKVKTALGRVEVDLWEGAVLRNSYRFGKSNQDYVYSMTDDSQGNIYYGLVYRRAQQRFSSVDTSINQTDLSGHGKTGGIQHTYATGFEFSRERGWNATYTLGGRNAAGVVAIPTYTVRNVATGVATALSATRCPLGTGAAGGYYCTDLTNPTPNDPFYNVTSATNVTTASPSVPVTNTLVKNFTPNKQVTSTRSFYGFDTIRFVEQLQATVGIRYDHYDSLYRSALTCVATSALPCSFPLTSNLVNYQVGVGYKPVKAGTIYGAVSSAATPPGNSLGQGQDPSSITTPVNQALPPEKTRSVEGGVKWELFGAKALATAAYFQSNTDNVRITLADSTIAAAGSRRNRGLDFGITGYINRKWQLFGGYTFMSAILTNAGGAAAANGLQNGRRFPNTPEHSFSVTSYYSVTRKLNLGGGIYGSGKVFGADNPTSIYTTKWVPAYARVDIYGSYHFNNHLDLQANLQNVGDKTYFLQAYTTHFAQLAPGRQGRLTFNVRF
jgi:catecholate siderophore receptor